MKNKFINKLIKISASVVLSLSCISPISTVIAEDENENNTQYTDIYSEDSGNENQTTEITYEESLNMTGEELGNTNNQTGEIEGISWENEETEYSNYISEDNTETSSQINLEENKETEIIETPSEEGEGVDEDGIKANKITIKNANLLGAGNGSTAEFATGTTVNLALKKLANPSINSAYRTEDTITSFSYSSTIPEGATTTVISSASSATPIYAWLEGTDLKWNTEASTVSLNPTSNNMFYNLRAMTDFDFSFPGTFVDNSNSISQFLGNNTSLTSVTLPPNFGSNATNLSRVFSNNTALTSVTLPSGFGNNATSLQGLFQNCSSLTEVNISDFNPVNVTDLSYLFSYCSNYDVENSPLIDKLPWGNVTNLSQTFTNTPISDLSFLPSDFGSSATSIIETFRSCTNLEYAVLPDNFGQYATDTSSLFNGCTNLKEVTIPNASLTSNASRIGYMFYNNSSLEKIYVPAGTDWSNLIHYYCSWNDGTTCRSYSTSTQNVLYNTTALTGSSGSVYDSSVYDDNPSETPYSSVEEFEPYINDAKYAKIDGGTLNPGLFSAINGASPDALNPVIKLNNVQQNSGEVVFASVSDPTNKPSKTLSIDSNSKTVDLYPGTETSAGTYTYTITQVPGNNSEITYDTQTYTITYTVNNDMSYSTSITNGNGQTVSPSEIVFNNTKQVYETTLLKGITFAGKLKSLVGITAYDTADTTVKAFKHSTTPPPEGVTTVNIAINRQPVVLAWLDSSDNTIYWYSEADVVNFNSNTSYSFYNFQGMEEIDLSGITDKNTSNMNYMFYGNYALTDLTMPEGFGSYAQNMSGMFRDTRAMESYAFPSGFGSMATNMNSMFYNDTSLKYVDLPSGFGSAATDMSYMFYGDTSLVTLNLPEGFGSQATNLNRTFYDTRDLENINFPEGFGQNATDASYMLYAYKAPSVTDPDGNPLTTLTLPEHFLEKITDYNKIKSLFQGRNHLTTIYAPADLDLIEQYVTDVNNDCGFLSGDMEIVGAAGSTYNFHKIGANFAKKDGGSLDTGYFTPTEPYVSFPAITPHFYLDGVETLSSTSQTLDPETYKYVGTDSGYVYYKSLTDPVNKPELEFAISDASIGCQTAGVCSFNATAHGTLYKEGVIEQVHSLIPGIEMQPGTYVYQIKQASGIDDVVTFDDTGTIIWDDQVYTITYEVASDLSYTTTVTTKDGYVVPEGINGINFVNRTPKKLTVNLSAIDEAKDYIVRLSVKTETAVFDKLPAGSHLVYEIKKNGEVVDTIDIVKNQTLLGNYVMRFMDVTVKSGDVIEVTNLDSNTSVAGYNDYISAELVDNNNHSYFNATEYNKSLETPITEDTTWDFIEEASPSNLSLGLITSGNEASKNQYFKVSLSLSGADANTSYEVDLSKATSGTIPKILSTNPSSLTTDENGSVSADFYMKHNEFIKITGLPVTAAYTVSEEKQDYKELDVCPTLVKTVWPEEDVAGTKSFNDPLTGTLSQNTYVGFNNVMHGSVPTGASTRFLTGFILLIVAIGGAALSYRKKK